MSHDEALNEIARIIQSGDRPTRRIDRIYRVLVQAGVIRAGQ